MSDLKLYRVIVRDTDTVLQLSDADAKKRGLGEKDLYKPKAQKRGVKPTVPEEKQATKPADKQAPPATDKA